MAPAHVGAIFISVMTFRLFHSALLAATVFLVGCGNNAMLRTISESIPMLAPGVDAINLQPNRNYLRVTVRQRAALMVLGYRDPHAAGAIDTWYSAEGETLRLQNGRIVGTAGLETDWREVRWPSLPSWNVLRQQSRIEFRRERDEMPGYRFGATDDLVLRRIVLPEDTELVGWEPEELTWFEERQVGAGGAVAPALYALKGSGDDWRVVYSEQCLSPTLCLAWQEWPVKR
jgi:hypothetical protein